MAEYQGEDTIDRVLSRVENNDSFYTREHIMKAINYGLQTTNIWLGFAQDEKQIISVANRVCYEVPYDLVLPMSVSFDGRTLYKSSFDALVSNSHRLLKETNVNTGIQPLEWALFGTRKFFIYPADGRGGHLIQISGVVEAPQFVLESDIITVPVNIMNTIVDYAAHLVQCKLTGRPFFDSLAFYNGYRDFTKMNSIWRTVNQPYYNVETSSK